jgi:predicted phosphodiesterase
MREPSTTTLDKAFAAYTTPLIFYGHHHPFSDIQGRARYINPGSLGCAATAVARYTRVEVNDRTYTITHHHIPYDDTPLYHAFEQRQVPERAIIYRAFFGGRFGT